MIVSYMPLTIPANYGDMESYIIQNKFDLTQHVVSAIEHAVNNKLSSIEIFNFKNTEYIITVDKSSFIINLNNIFEIYLNDEKYEFCDRICKLIKRLETNEKTKEKRHESNNSTKRKTKK